MDTPTLTIMTKGRQPINPRGTVGLLAVGLALYQAWWLSVVLGGISNVFPAEGAQVSSVSTSAVSYAQLAQFLALSIMVFTDQLLLRLYSSRITLVVASFMSALGTAGSTSCALADMPAAVCIFSQSLAGIGAAIIVMFWGVAYSRQNVLTIVVNASLSVALAFCLTAFLRLLPSQTSAVLLCLLPLLCFPLLWSFTPVSYAIRHSIPIFNPLPLNVLSFSLRLAVPTILMGVVLSLFFKVSPPQATLGTDTVTRFFMVAFGGLSVLVVSMTSFTVRQGVVWDHLSRLLMVAIVLCTLFLPFGTGGNPWPFLLVTIGCMLLCIFIWVFCGQLSQNFRVSPILIFSTVYSGVIAGFMLEGILENRADWLMSLLPYGSANEVVVALVCVVFAYALLPRAQDIKRSIIPAEENDENAVADLNRQLQQIIHSAQREMDDLALAFAQEDGRANEKLLGRKPGKNGLRAHREDHEKPTGTLFRTDKTESFPKGSAEERDHLDEDLRNSGHFRFRCETVANNHMLSRRETEVMFLLAKGYSTNRIMEELYVSRSTAKTHIAHIYRKLDIHSRQELQEMIDAGHAASDPDAF